MKKYVSRAEKGFDEFCVSYFAYDADIENYCREKYIPTHEGNNQLTISFNH
jgi:hypothetical protein